MYINSVVLSGYMIYEQFPKLIIISSWPCPCSILKFVSKKTTHFLTMRIAELCSALLYYYYFGYEMKLLARVYIGLCTS